MQATWPTDTSTFCVRYHHEALNVGRVDHPATMPGVHCVRRTEVTSGHGSPPGRMVREATAVHYTSGQTRLDDASHKRASDHGLASVQQTGVCERFNASGCKRSGKSGKRFERIYPRGGPEAATSERLLSENSRCKRRFHSIPPFAPKTFCDHFVPEGIDDGEKPCRRRGCTTNGCLRRLSRPASA